MPGLSPLRLDLRHRGRDREGRLGAQLEVGLDLAERCGLLGQREQVEAGWGRGLSSEVDGRKRVRGEEGDVGDITQISPDRE